MDYWRDNTIIFEQISENLQAELNLKEVKLNESKLQGVDYLTLWYHKSKLRNLDDLHIPTSLLYLDLTWSNIQNFIGIERFSNLKRLELNYCTKLQSDLGVSGLANTLEHLFIDHSKKFIPNEELFSLKNLRILHLHSCGNLENLKFLNEFPKLIEFRFVDTNVLDGDLSPIINHPTIRNVGFLNKRHYNITREEIGSVLSGKNDGEEYMTGIKYGEYETHRYIY